MITLQVLFVATNISKETFFNSSYLSLIESATDFLDWEAVFLDYIDKTLSIY